MIVRIAVGNVRRSIADFSVYFITLCFAACMLYSFTASTDYLVALDLTEDQRAVYAQAGDVVRAFSVFTVVVFAFLVAYANRFLVRRRKREFALYHLLGMNASFVSAILAIEAGVVSVCALAAGIALGVALSPVFNFVAAIVFGVPWTMAFAASGSAALWICGSFVGITVLAGIVVVTDVNRRTLLDLMYAERAPERPRLRGRVSCVLQMIAAALLLGAVWGICLLYPTYFVLLVLPLGFAALFGTYFLFRVVTSVSPRMARRSRRYLEGLRMVVARQFEAKVESSCVALACVCVFVAAAVCMVCAGLALSVGVQGGAYATDTSAAFAAEGVSSTFALSVAPLAYVCLLYGLTFLVAAGAILAIQQLSDAADNRRAYELITRLGADEGEMRRAVARQVGRYFTLPVVTALVHSVFGLQVIALFALAAGAASFKLIVGSAVLVVVAVMVGYYALCTAACVRMLVTRTAPEAGRPAQQATAVA